MNKRFTQFLILIAIFWTKGAVAQYCTTNLYTTFGCTDNDYVNSFSTTGGISNITNNNSGCNGGVSGYTFFSSQTHATVQGTTVNYSFTNTPSFAEGYKIWVDFNGNGLFTDPGEQVYASTGTIGAGATVTGNFTVPMTAIPGMTRLRIRCVFANTTFTPCSNHTFGEVEDYNFQIIAATPCSGAPTAGIASASTGCPVVISISGASLQANLLWQWQKKSICDQAWANIPGATNMNYTPPSSSIPTQYRVYVVCTNSNLADTTNIVSLGAVAPCYCTSSATSTADEDIFEVTIDNMTSVSNCGTTGGPGSVQNRYSDYTTVVPAVVLYRGQTTPFRIKIGTCGGNYNNSTAMWVDFNKNGSFDATERVYVSPASANGPNTINGTFTVPLNAALDTVRVRVVNVETGTPSSITPCGTYTWGETEDYLAVIKYRPTVVGDSSYCSGSNVTLVSTVPPNITNPSFVWVDPNGNVSYGDTLKITNAQTIHQGVYATYAISSLCAGVPDTSGITYFYLYINQTPNPPSVASPFTYCQNATPDSIVIYGANVKWYDGQMNLLTGQPIISTVSISSDTFYATQTSLDGCVSPPATVIVNIAPNAPVPTVVSPVVYCQGDTPVPLSATGQNIRWYTTPTGGVGTAITPTPSTFGQGTFTWYATQTINGCESNRVPVVVNINYRPNAYISVSRPYVCQYDTISINYFGNAISTATYTWTMPVGATTLSGTDMGPILVRFDSAGTRRVFLQVDNGGCLGPLAYTDIIVRPSPVFLLDMQPEVCQGELAELTVASSSTGIDSFEWNFAGGDAYGSFPKGPYQVIWSSPGLKTVSAIAIDKGTRIDDIACRSLPVQKDIIVRELPTAMIMANLGGKICAGDSMRFEAYNEANYTFQWVPQQFFDEYSASVQWGKIDFPRYVYLKVTNQYNCMATDSVYVNAQPCCELTFPTAFTPNNDGLNDRFRAITLGNHEMSLFRIQNRWGQTVYESTNPAWGWDGTFNGVPQDMGTYFYFIRYKCLDGKTYENKGEFMLMR